MKLVLDTNVLISGLMYPNSVPGRIVTAWREARFELVTSPAQLREVACVLAYPRIARILNWERTTVERFLKQLYLRAEVVELPDRPEVEVPTDPDDTPILASLLISEADCLVTGDSDLLALADTHPIMTPAAFLDRHGPDRRS